MRGLAERGYVRFGHDAALADWVAAIRPHALAAAADPELRARWLRHGGTWMVGGNALPNRPDGSLPPDAGPLGGRAMQAIAADPALAHAGLDRAQVSAVYPGYPQRDPQESEAAHRFRRLRDAAHVDGIHALGPQRRRMLRESHAFILGIPVTRASPAAAPFVVWEGSHHIIGAALRDALGAVPPEEWAATDITEAYQAARRACLERCRRVVLAARPGEAYLVHRFALHGVAPWHPRARAEPAGRVILYFRPETARAPLHWLRPD